MPAAMDSATRSAKAPERKYALKAAAAVPLAVTEACVAVIDELEDLRQKGNPNLLSDVAVSAEFAFAALRCAWLNVEINLAYIKDETYVAQTRSLIDQRLAAAEAPARDVFRKVAEDIRSTD